MKDLRSYTPARVMLGQAGDSLPTTSLLEFRLAHAKARDAVEVPLDTAALQAEINRRCWQSLLLHSAAPNREEYLRRPDLGRKLASHSIAVLRTLSAPQRLVFALCDGLSARATERHALPLLDQVFKLLPREDFPLLIVQQARVAIGDVIGDILTASAIVLLIGERPGLSSPDSLGVYLTWNPRTGCTDANRNCISNIHASGLSYEAAAHKLVFLLQEMFRRQISGVTLKDTSAGQQLLNQPNV